MMAFPSMISGAAHDAGMKVPPDPDSDFDKNEYVHFWVYCQMQLGVPVKWGNHWKNSEILAAIPEEKLKSMTASDIFDMGFDP